MDAFVTHHLKGIFSDAVWRACPLMRVVDTTADAPTITGSGVARGIAGEVGRIFAAKSHDIVVPPPRSRRVHDQVAKVGRI